MLGNPYAMAESAKALWPQNDNPSFHHDPLFWLMFGVLYITPIIIALKPEIQRFFSND